MAVRRFRPRRRTRRSNVHADRHGQTQQHQPPGLARRRARPHRRSPGLTAQRAPAVALEGDPAARRRLSTGPPRCPADAYDGDGLCLFAKRLERGRFVWPRAEEGVVVLSRAQLSMLLEGIDWRMPQRTWRPELAG